MEIPWPANSSPALDQQESAGRLINAYAEQTDPGLPNKVIYYRAPGLNQILEIAANSHCRGFILVGSTLVVVLDDRVYTVTEFSSSFTATDRGAMIGTGLVTIASNSASTPQIVAVDTQNGAFNLFVSAAPTSFADLDLPKPNSVSTLNNYFLFTIGDGRIFATGINNVSVATNSFTTAPGPLLRGVSFRGEFFAFGSNFIAPYRDIAASPFPLEKAIPGVIPRGIVGTHAVAGWEPGWSNELIWVGDDCVVYKLEGYSAKPISTHNVSRIIERAADRSLLQASVAMAGQHAYWILKSPNEWTWVYDLTTGLWHERESFNSPAFRGSCSVKAFNRWVIGDETTGKLGEFSETTYREFDDALIFRMQSGLPPTFPARANIPRVDLDFTAGTGRATGEVPVETDPTVKVRWSNNAGGDWKLPVTRKLGQQGNPGKRVIVLNAGITTGSRRWEISVSDPVHVGFRGAQMAVIGLAP